MKRCLLLVIPFFFSCASTQKKECNLQEQVCIYKPKLKPPEAKSHVCKKSYNSTVVVGSAFQDYCLGKEKKPIDLTEFECAFEFIRLSKIAKAAPEIKDKIKRYDYIEVKVPKGYETILRYLLGTVNIVVDDKLKDGVYVKYCSPAPKTLKGR